MSWAIPNLTSDLCVLLIQLLGAFLNFEDFLLRVEELTKLEEFLLTLEDFLLRVEELTNL